MKLKYLIIISLLLTILTISTVSASEDANNTLTLDSAGDNQVTEIQNDNSKQDNLKLSTTEHIKEKSDNDKEIISENKVENTNNHTTNTQKSNVKTSKNAKNNNVDSILTLSGSEITEHKITYTVNNLEDFSEIENTIANYDEEVNAIINLETNTYTFSDTITGIY